MSKIEPTDTSEIAALRERYARQPQAEAARDDWHKTLKRARAFRLAALAVDLANAEPAGNC